MVEIQSSYQIMGILFYMRKTWFFEPNNQNLGCIIYWELRIWSSLSFCGHSKENKTTLQEINAYIDVIFVYKPICLHTHHQRIMFLSNYIPSNSENLPEEQCICDREKMKCLLLLIRMRHDWVQVIVVPEIAFLLQPISSPTNILHTSNNWLSPNQSGY